MADDTLTSHQVDGVGLVELPGVGPWVVHEVNHNSFDIRDSRGRITNPHVTPVAIPGRRGTKRDMNVTFAAKSVPNAIVKRFNAELASA